MLNAETTGIGVAALVRHHITELLGEAGMTVGRLDDTDELNALGLNSLMLARLILQLEMETGVDSVPAVGPETMLNVRAPPSGSDPVRVIVNGAVPLVETV